VLLVRGNKKINSDGIKIKAAVCHKNVPHIIIIIIISGFGGLEVACRPLVPKFAGSNPAEVVGFFGQNNPQHAFLRRGSKTVCPMSCFTACKRTQK
jgi:hypothetical protein